MNSLGKPVAFEVLYELDKQLAGKHSFFPTSLTAGPGPITSIKPFIPQCRLGTHGPILAMDHTTDGSMVAAVTDLGLVSVWKTSDWSLISQFTHDVEGLALYFNCCLFHPTDPNILFVSGRTGDRNVWDNVSDENVMVASSIYAFDLTKRVPVYEFKGIHTLGVNSLKTIFFRGEWYLVSCGQDGKIIKWRLDDFATRETAQAALLSDPGINIAYGIEVLPSTGNRYIAAATDCDLKIIDFEDEVLLASFTMFTLFCDQVIVLPPNEAQPFDFLLACKGVDMSQPDDINEPSTWTTKVRLVDLSVPKSPTEKFIPTVVQELSHDEFKSFKPGVKMAADRDTLFTPTDSGLVLCWPRNPSGETLSLQHAAHNSEYLFVRQVSTLGGTSILTCGDDGQITVFKQ